MKLREFLPFPIFKSGGSLRSQPPPQSQPRSQSPAFSFSLLPTPSRLLLVAFSLLLLTTSCKDVGVPPERIIPPPGPDTTSHSFVWTIDTLGDGSGGTLYDVAIINDTLAYAVGEIYLKDSSGQIDPQPYNLVRWGGEKWSLQRITLNLYNFDCTVAGTYFGDLVTIFAFNDGTVIFTDGADVIRWNGVSSARLACSNGVRTGAFTKFWGVSTSDFYAVGKTGTIAHFNGSTWTKIESGTTLDFQDIWGETSASDTTILAVASDPFHSFEKYIASVTGTTVTALSDSGIPEPLSGVWFRSGERYFVVGSGIYRKQSLTENRWTGAPLELTPYYSNAVRGTDTNNVVVVGAFADVLHYNGSTWKSYPDLLRNASLLRVVVKGKLVMAVGFWEDGGLIVRGIRQ